MTILVANLELEQMERYERELRDSMPYANTTLQVNEFRGSSQSTLLWTTTEAMAAWTTFRQLWGEGIYLPYAFRRIGEGGHAAQSQHYAGTAFDCAQNLPAQRRNQLRQRAEASGLWSYVEPAYLTPTWVHLDKRVFPPACTTGGYPIQRRGNIGVYVCILQDALNIVQNAGLLIDGVFGTVTEDQVAFFQATQGFYADGIVGCTTWQRLTSLAVGKGCAC